LAHTQETPPRASRLVPGLAHEFDAVVARAMRKDPARRYESAGRFADAIGRAAEAHAAAASHPPGRLAAAAARAKPAGRPAVPARRADHAATPAAPAARRLGIALSDPFNVAVLAVLVVVGLVLGAFLLMLPLALLVYAAGVARTYLDPATRERAAGVDGDGRAS
jgi:eukaryotic-like serine/threonine-protein kinase